jgi:hypothetical protein
LGGRILNSRGTDVSGHPLNRVGQPLGQGPIISGQSGRDALGGIGLSVRELVEEFSIQLLVTRHPHETFRRVEPRHLR